MVSDDLAISNHHIDFNMTNAIPLSSQHGIILLQATFYPMAAFSTVENLLTNGCTAFSATLSLLANGNSAFIWIQCFPQTHPCYYILHQFHCTVSTIHIMWLKFDNWHFWEVFSWHFCLVIQIPMKIIDEDPIYNESALVPQTNLYTKTQWVNSSTAVK